MIIAYERVSTGKQDSDNQRYEIDNFCKYSGYVIDEYVIEVVSGTKDYHNRKLGETIKNMKEGDLLICTEISRLARSLYQVFDILRIMSERGIGLITIKDNFELSNTIQSKVLAFAFGLASEIERQMISQRTMQALERKKAEGITLGRPKGSLNKKVKLSGKEDAIRILLSEGHSISKISRLLHCDRSTLTRFIKNHMSEQEKVS